MSRCPLSSYQYNFFTEKGPDPMYPNYCMSYTHGTSDVSGMQKVCGSAGKGVVPEDLGAYMGMMMIIQNLPGITTPAQRSECVKSMLADQIKKWGLCDSGLRSKVHAWIDSEAKKNHMTQDQVKQAYALHDHILDLIDSACPKTNINWIWILVVVVVLALIAASWSNSKK